MSPQWRRGAGRVGAIAWQTSLESYCPSNPLLKTKSSAENVADTVQSPVIAPVVYVSPASEPPQPETLWTWYGGVAVTVNVVVAPSLTVCGVSGAIAPPAPAFGVTV